MVTIELMGGLGNQMFQFALALKIKSLGRNVCIRPLFANGSSRKYELDCFEGVRKCDIPISYDDVEDDNGDLIRRIKRLFVKRKPDIYSDRIIEYQPEVLEYDNVILSGYWQNEKYFADIREKILNTYSFQKELSEKWKKMFYETCHVPFDAECENSVSIHVRRTDYVLPQYEVLYGGICTIEYYKKAMTYCIEKLNNPIFYFFSDDMKWVKDELVPRLVRCGLSDYRLIDAECDDVAKDMWMMSRCRHHIIANSTYSWWGAWLGDNKDKIVVAPSKWMNKYSDDVICKDWYRIDGC